MTILATRSRVKRKAAIVLEGQSLVVWSPFGSVGKTTIALNLAYESALLGKRVLLIDLDTYAPAINQLLPIDQPTAGLAGAARLIRQGRFTFEELDRLSAHISRKNIGFRLLTGLGSHSRWPEITAETVTQLLAIARNNFDLVLVDVASQLDANLFSGEHVTDRNAATRSALQNADRLLVVLGGNQVSLARYLAVHGNLDELQKSRAIVVNRSTANAKLNAALKDLTRETVLAFIPNDETAVSLAENQLLPLAIARRKSVARNAIAALAHKLLAWQPSVK